jgi:hypothetical protein
MTVSTFFSSSEDGRIRSIHSVYSTARAGSSLAMDKTSAGAGSQTIGQHFDATNYTCFEMFLDFDTSSIPDTDTIESVVLSVYGNANESTTDFTVEARLHDWGPTLETADWVAGADLASKTLLATFNTASWTIAGYNDFTSDGAFVSNINKTGVTRLVLCSSRHRVGTTPTGLERVHIYASEQADTTQDPKLVVNHSAGGGGATVTRRTLLGVGV